MTNEERCLKMMKIERYKNDLSEEEKKISHYALVLTVGTFGAVSLINLGDLASADFLTQAQACLRMVGAATLPEHLRRMITSICKKTNLESKISDLELDLEFAEISQEGKKL